MSTSLVTRAGPSWRALMLVLAGMAAGVLATNIVAGGTAAVGVSPAATARWASCPGVAFTPRSDDQAYGAFASARVGEGSFVCDLTLPHGATITAVRWHFFDEDPTARVGSCWVVRTGLDPVGDIQELSGDAWTEDAFDGGYVRRTDTTIAFPVVDNMRFAYHASCQTPREDPALRILGVNVRHSP